MSDEDDINLRSLTRADLNAYAAAHGIADPEGYANKDELAAAVDAALLAEDADQTTEADDDGDQSPSGDEYHVLKAFTLDDGRTVMPGETFSFEGNWPARRAKQMIEQKYLRPKG